MLIGIYRSNKNHAPMAQSSHTGMALIDAETACNLSLIMSWIMTKAYTKRAMAPTIIERDSAAA
jgi:hypothetical protein